MSLLILVVDDEPDVEVLFRQQFRRDLRAGRFTMEFVQAGIGDYLERDTTRVLETGDMPNGDCAMRAVVRNTSELAAEDRAAIALYVKSLPPVEGPKHP